MKTNSMFTPFNEKNNKKEDENILNPESFRNIEPIVKSGDIYPNLFSQACYINQYKDKLKEKSLSIILDIMLQLGDHSIEIIADAIWKSIKTEASAIEDIDVNEDSVKLIFNDMESIAYEASLLIKFLMECLQIRNRMRGIEKDIEHTKNHVLL